MTPCTIRTLLALTTFAALTACGGAGSQIGGVDHTDSEILSYNDLQNTLDYSNPGDLPAGQATYRGDITFVSGSQGMEGDISILARFDDEAVSGQVSHLVHTNGSAYSGILTIADGDIDILADPNDDWTYRADVDGTLTGGGQNLQIAGEIAGDFYGPGAQYTGGLAAIEACGPTCTVYDGEFIAQR
jgi:hypothetical protein